MEANSEGVASFEFEGFRVFPRQREIRFGDDPVELGSRAFDLLLALIEKCGTCIGTNDLINIVWPGVFVSESNLRVQISGLRSKLGAARDRIRTIPGRGYQFTGQVHRVSATNPATGEGRTGAINTPRAASNYSDTIPDLIGRNAELLAIINLVRAHRLVTLTGPGGIGKTRLAFAASRQLSAQFPDGVWLVDLGALRDPAAVPATIAAAIGLEVAVGQEGFADRVVAALKSRRLLIVLDTCEHVIADAPRAVETLLRASIGSHVLATSREPLGAEGEWVFRVKPLAVPAGAAVDPQNYGAVSLFVARALETESGFVADHRCATAIADICRRLDGIPLAIELAATRAATLGIGNLGAYLDDHLQLLTCGKRTAPPRHQTFRASLDWSYELLTEVERTVLRRLAIFRGPFGLAAARTVASGADINPAEIIDALANLVGKSLVLTETDTGSVRYRLLETNRDYALEKLMASGEFEDIAARFAQCNPHEVRPVAATFGAHQPLPGAGAVRPGTLREVAISYRPPIASPGLLTA